MDLRQSIYDATQNGYDVFRNELGCVPKKNIISPLRNEKKPSFNIYKSKDGIYLFNDFAAGGGDCIQFVSERYGISYKEALQRLINQYVTKNENVVILAKPKTAANPEKNKDKVRKVYLDFQTETLKQYPRFESITNFLTKKLSTDFQGLQSLEKQGIISYLVSSKYHFANSETIRKGTYDNSTILVSAKNSDKESAKGCLYAPKRKSEHKDKINFGSNAYFANFDLEKANLEKENIILCEGISDYLALSANGFKAITFGGVNMGGFGYWNFEQDKEKPISQIVFEQLVNCQIYVCYDTDFEGFTKQKKIVSHFQKFACNAFSVLLNGFDYQIEKNQPKPTRNDICDYFQDFGLQRFDFCLKQAKNSGFYATQSFEFFKYLSELESQIIDFCQKSFEFGNKQCVINAPTGAGKTFSFVQKIIPKLLQDGKKAIFAVPTNLILQQIQSSNYPNCLIYSSLNKELELLNDESANVIVTTYDLVGNLNSAVFENADLLVIDEFDLLENAQNYRASALGKMTKIATDNNLKIIGLTATLPNFIKYQNLACNSNYATYAPYFDVLKLVRTEKKDLKFKRVVISQDEKANYIGAVSDYVLSLYQLDRTKQFVIYLNDCEKHLQVKQTIEGLCGNLKIGLLQSNLDNQTKDCVIDNQVFNEDILITTKVLESGVNLRNDATLIYVVNQNDKEVNSVAQFIGRLREAKKIDFHILIKPETEPKNAPETTYTRLNYDERFERLFRKEMDISIQELLRNRQDVQDFGFYECFGTDKTETSIRNHLKISYLSKSIELDYYGLTNDVRNQSNLKLTYSEFCDKIQKELENAYNLANETVFFSSETKSDKLDKSFTKQGLYELGSLTHNEICECLTITMPSKTIPNELKIKKLDATTISLNSQKWIETYFENAPKTENLENLETFKTNPKKLQTFAESYLFCYERNLVNDVMNYSKLNEVLTKHQIGKANYHLLHVIHTETAKTRQMKSQISTLEKCLKLGLSYASEYKPDVLVNDESLGLHNIRIYKNLVKPESKPESKPKNALKSKPKNLSKDLVISLFSKKLGITNKEARKNFDLLFVSETKNGKTKIYLRFEVVLKSPHTKTDNTQSPSESPSQMDTISALESIEALPKRKVMFECEMLENFEFMFNSK